MDITTTIVIFNVLSSLGVASGVFFILVACLSKKISRLPTWYLVMSIGALYALSMLLLVGSQVKDEEPVWDLCFAQAALVYALPVGFTSAGATFAIQLHLTLKHFVLNQNTRLNRNSLLLVFIPLVLVVAMIILVVVIGVSNPAEVSRSSSHMYCRLENPTAARTSGALCGLAGLSLLVTQVFTIRLIWPRWRSSAATNLPTTSGGLVSRGTIFRLIILDVMALSAILLGVFKGVMRTSSVAMNLYISALSLLGLFAFGISTLPFRRSEKTTTPPSRDIENTSSFEEGDKSSTSYSSRTSTPLPINLTTQ